MTFLYNHDCISSSLFCHHTLCGFFSLFWLLSMQVPGSWNSSSETENKQEPEHHSCLLSPPLPWLSLGVWGQVLVLGGVSAVPKSLPSCPVLSAGPELFTAVPFILSSCRAPVVINGWCLDFLALLDPGGWRKLNYSCCLFPRIFIHFP